MAITATLHRLRRFVAALIVLALPLQGQAVASMACHTVSAGHAVGHHHASHNEPTQPIHGAHLAETVSDRAILVTATDLPGTPSDSMSAESCALCAAGCSVAAPLPASHKSISVSITDHQQPTWHISSAYAGVVLDGLLRPPR
jgi:hypothetical protein